MDKHLQILLHWVQQVNSIFTVSSDALEENLFPKRKSVLRSAQIYVNGWNLKLADVLLIKSFHSCCFPAARWRRDSCAVVHFKASVLRMRGVVFLKKPCLSAFDWYHLTMNHSLSSTQQVAALRRCISHELICLQSLSTIKTEEAKQLKCNMFPGNGFK